MPEKQNKIQDISNSESAVPELKQPLQVSFGMSNYKLMRGIVHKLYQPCCFIDNSGAVAPGENRSKERRDLNILFFSKSVWNRDRIVFNKRRLIIFINLPVQK